MNKNAFEKLEYTIVEGDPQKTNIRLHMHTPQANC